jgi:hypothetical protein
MLAPILLWALVALQQQPPPSTTLAAEALRAKEFNRAEILCREILESNPNDPKALINLGLSLEGQGKTSIAISHWNSLMGLGLQGLPSDKELAARVETLKVTLLKQVGSRLEDARRELEQLNKDRIQLLQPLEKQQVEAIEQLEKEHYNQLQKLGDQPSRDEFETSSQYQDRLANFRKQRDDSNACFRKSKLELEIKFSLLKNDSSKIFDRRIQELMSQKYILPFRVKLASYDADKSSYQVMVEPSQGTPTNKLMAKISVSIEQAKELKLRKDIIWAEKECGLADLPDVKPNYLVDSVLGKFALVEIYNPQDFSGRWTGGLNYYSYKGSVTIGIDVKIKQIGDAISGTINASFAGGYKGQVLLQGKAGENGAQIKTGWQAGMNFQFNEKNIDIKRINANEAKGTWSGWEEGGSHQVNGDISLILQPSVDPAAMPEYPKKVGAYALQGTKWVELPRNNGMGRQGIGGILGGFASGEVKLAELVFDGKKPLPQVKAGKVTIIYVGEMKPAPAGAPVSDAIQMKVSTKDRNGNRVVDLVRIAPGWAGFGSKRIGHGIIVKPEEKVTMFTAVATRVGTYGVDTSNENFFELEIVP